MFIDLRDLTVKSSFKSTVSFSVSITRHLLNEVIRLLFYLIIVVL